MRNILFIILSCIVLTACHTDEQKNDVSFSGNVKVFRYDRLQYEASVQNSFSAMQKMGLEFPRATKLLIEDVLALGRVEDPAINEKLCSYYSDSTLVQIMNDANVKFKDMSKIEKGLTSGFRNLKEELPDIQIPKVYSLFSALNQSVVVGDSLLGFSLDKYMGADYPLYRRYYYEYQRRTMTPERILPDCFTFYLLSQYPFQWIPGHRTLKDVIMHQGKIRWVAQKVLGIHSDTEIMGYSKEETEWCRKNKDMLWHWMVANEHLDSTDPMLIRAYTHPDPSMVFKGEKIPPLIGVWMGLKLVEKFVQEHPDITTAELMDMTDFGPVGI
ncbi:gliding motility lipoprotein GldB [uncultured Bacteroides sp.]|uniref:gliding motility protein GldB-related protein n=1 Tax=uncultured Bacteroides sp. TaxID=162156 RepID=UPI002629FA8A|nr:gliding motility lipoprotein GldB [uncultured Bacteroides sp.]